MTNYWVFLPANVTSFDSTTIYSFSTTLTVSLFPASFAVSTLNSRLPIKNRFECSSGIPLSKVHISDDRRLTETSIQLHPCGLIISALESLPSNVLELPLEPLLRIAIFKNAISLLSFVSDDKNDPGLSKRVQNLPIALSDLSTLKNNTNFQNNFQPQDPGPQAQATTVAQSQNQYLQVLFDY